MKTVLLVEDQPLLAMMTEMWLVDLGLKVTRCENGIEAKNILKKEQFNYLVTDLVMPNLDGAGLLDWMVSEGISIPTIIITGINDAEEIKKVQRIPFVNAVLEKPLTPQQLESAKLLIDG